MNLTTARTKRCARCSDTKPVDEFGRQTNGKTPRGYCRPCQADYAREWQRKHPARYATNKHAEYERRATRFSLWKLAGTWDGLHAGYARALAKDPCAYCGGQGGEADHIVPVMTPRRGRSKALAAEWDNLAGACQRCNITKGRQSLLEFLCWPSGWLTWT